MRRVTPVVMKPQLHHPMRRVALSRAGRQSLQLLHWPPFCSLQSFRLGFAQRWLSTRRHARGGVGAVPRIGEIESVEEVLRVHRQHSKVMRQMDVSACWNTLGKLVKRRPSERQWLRLKLRERPDVLQPLVDTTLAHLPRLKARPLANATHGLGAVSECVGFAADQRVWERLADRSLLLVDDLSSQAFSNIVYAFSKAGRSSPALFDAVAQEAQGRLHEFKPQALANTAWAYATLGHASPALFDAVAKAAQGRLHEFKSQDLANTAWAYATADVSSAALFGDRRFTESCATADLTGDQLCQLHQWQLWLEEHGHSWPPLPMPLAQRCRVAFCAGDGNPSRLQRSVAKVLAELKLSPREEVRTAQGYSLDAVVGIDGCDVAVEVDGPSHFVGRSRTPTGATALKRRQLRAAGWRLLPIPYWEWNALSRDPAGQREYLTSGLKAAAAVTSFVGRDNNM
jgi:hypothetical protein